MKLNEIICDSKIEEEGKSHMKTYLSYGGGVNSTAMAIIRDYDEIIFCDTGAEHPETYEYIDYFQKKFLDRRGKRIITISAMDMGLEKEDLFGFYQKYQMIPSRMMRACTMRFKVKPIHKYYHKSCIQLIGIDAGEAHRAKPSKTEGITSDFPLIERGINRRRCMEIIQGAGLCLPKKSGCYFCAFQGLAGYRALYKKHPDLFKIVCEMEERHHQKYNLEKNSEEWIFIKEKPMKELAIRFQQEIEADDVQLEFDDIQDNMNCLCKFA